MEPNLLVGDHLLVNKFVFAPTPRPPRARAAADAPDRRGDIIVFKFPEEPERDFIKRVIGLPGDTLELEEPDGLHQRPGARRAVRALTCSRRPATTRPTSFDVRERYGPVTVPDGHYFMMGDNRDNSQDSRYWGFLPQTYVKGRALFIYWSFDTPETVAGRIRAQVGQAIPPDSLSRKDGEGGAPAAWDAHEDPIVKIVVTFAVLTACFQAGVSTTSSSRTRRSSACCSRPRANRRRGREHRPEARDEYASRSREETSRSAMVGQDRVVEMNTPEIVPLIRASSRHVEVHAEAVDADAQRHQRRRPLRATQRIGGGGAAAAAASRASGARRRLERLVLDPHRDWSARWRQRRRRPRAAARSPPRRRWPPTRCRCSATHARARALAAARSVSSGTSVAPCSADWIAGRARRLLVVESLSATDTPPSRDRTPAHRHRPARQPRADRRIAVARAFASAAFSSSVLFFDLARPRPSPATSPIAPAIAAAGPPPGVGFELANASSNCATDISENDIQEF